jgi:hypothetical protein
MAALNVGTVVAPGVAAATVAASAGGDTVAGASDGRTWLEITNGSGGSINVTIADPGATPAGNSSAGRVIAVAPGATQKIFLPPGAVASNGLVSIAYSAVTTVTVAAYRI